MLQAATDDKGHVFEMPRRCVDSAVVSHVFAWMTCRCLLYCWWLGVKIRRRKPLTFSVWRHQRFLPFKSVGTMKPAWIWLLTVVFSSSKKRWHRVLARKHRLDIRENISDTVSCKTWVELDLEKNWKCKLDSQKKRNMLKILRFSTKCNFIAYTILYTLPLLDWMM